MAKRKVSNKNRLDNKTKEKPIKLSFIEKVIPPSILTILTIIFYYPSLNYPFQFDDLANITKKFSIRFDNPLSRWYKSSRWIGDWLNRMNFDMGRFDTFAYRVTNLAIHILAGIVLFYLIIDLCQFLKKKNFLFKNAILIGFTTSALFLLHPVQTQTVSYVIQARLEGLATLFILTVLLFFTRAFHSKNIITRSILLSLSFVTAFLSYGTKEIIIAIPFLWLLVDWFFISQETWGKFKQRAIIYAGFSSVFFVFLFRYLSFDFFKRVITLQQTIGNNRGNIITTSARDLITAGQFLISSFKVVLHYLWIFVWPFNMSVEYDWILAKSFWAADAFLPFLALSTIIGLIIYFAVKKKYTFLTFGLIWFFISIAPRSSIIPSPELVCDYKTYLASVGWLFILAVLIVKAIKHLETKITINAHFFKSFNGKSVAITLFAIILGLGTYGRNLVWETPVTFWTDNIKKAPKKARSHNNLGVALAEEHKLDEAITCYEKAIRLDRFYSDPLSNIAAAFSLKGELEKAINALRHAIYINPYYPEAFNNLGTLLIKTKDYDQAEKILNQAIALRGYYGKAYHNLGRLYMEKKEPEKALTYFKKATTGDLDTMEGFFSLGNICLQLQKYDEAVKAFERSTQLGGTKHPQIVFNLANAYFLNKELDKAENIYRNLSESNPMDPRFIFNLGETLFAKEKFKESLPIFKRAVSIPKALPQAHLRLAETFEKLKLNDEAKSYLQRLLNTKASDNFKEFVKKQLHRLEVQEQMNSQLKAKMNKDGVIKVTDLNKILAKAKEIKG